MVFFNLFKNKTVLVTGHTGFKGSWLTLWLVLLGAKVIGLSINIPTNPSHFRAIKLQDKIKHKKIDIRNIDENIRYPNFIIHKLYNAYQYINLWRSI